MAKDAATGGDGREDLEGQPEPPTVEKRLEKLETALNATNKALDEERKSSAGKDRKITDLAEAKRKLEESTLSKDKLLEIREQEQKEREAEWSAKNEAERQELEQARVELMKHKVIAKLENFPPALASYVTGKNEEEIEANARNLLKTLLKEREKVNNVRKTTGPPQSGNGKATAGWKSGEDVEAMTPVQKKQWAETASKEEFEAAFIEMQTGSK